MLGILLDAAVILGLVYIFNEGEELSPVWMFDGQSVKVAHVLEEGDVIEIHW